MLALFAIASSAGGFGREFTVKASEEPQAQDTYEYVRGNPWHNPLPSRTYSIAPKIIPTSSEQCRWNIIQRESGWNSYAINKSSGACGLVQALPCKKLGCDLGDVECQLRWFDEYVKERYGGACQAWSFWQKNHWY